MSNHADLFTLAARHRIALPVLNRLAQATHGVAAAATLETRVKRQRLVLLHCALTGTAWMICS